MTKRVSKGLSHLQAAAILAVVATCLAMVLATVAYANHSWNGYHWARTANPFTIKLGNNVSSAWQKTLAQTSSDWSQSSVLDTTSGPGSSRPRNCRPTAGRPEVCNS